MLSIDQTVGQVHSRANIWLNQAEDRAAHWRYRIHVVFASRSDEELCEWWTILKLTAQWQWTHNGSDDIWQTLIKSNLSNKVCCVAIILIGLHGWIICSWILYKSTCNFVYIHPYTPSALHLASAKPQICPIGNKVVICKYIFKFCTWSGLHCFNACTCAVGITY